MEDLGPEVVRRADAVHVDKPDGTAVDYFIFDEFEVHDNLIAPGAEQAWHHHTRIEETILVTRGSLDVISHRDGKISRVSIGEGDLVRMHRSVHILANPNEQPAGFVVFRFVPDGVSKADLITNDKILDRPPSECG